MAPEPAIDYAFLAGHELEMFSTKTCPDCHRLSQLLRVRKVEFAKVLVDEDEEAIRALEVGAGKRAVPYLRLDGQHWVRGYHAAEPGRLSEALLVQELRAASGA